MPARLACPWDRHLLRLGLALAALGGLTACASSSPEDSSQVGSPAPTLRPGSAGNASQAPQAGTPSAPGLIPLPSAQTVLSQVPIGRTDPFGPLLANQPAATVITVPAGFRVQGVLRVAGRDQAFVQSSAGSGVVCVGPRGRCDGASEPLLPRGTSVVAIQPRLGCITIAASGQRQRYCLRDS